MSEPTSPPAAGNFAEHRAHPLTPEAVEAVLTDFRAWLQDMASAPAAGVNGAGSSEPPVDLHTLVSQFVALRHEVNLQTKAARAQMEQNAEAVRRLEQVLEAAAPGQPADPHDESFRPLLKSLVDAADALALAKKEVERLQAAARDSLEQMRSEAVVMPTPSLLARWFGGASKPQSRVAHPQQQVAEQTRKLLDSVLTGYAMSVQRLERTLEQQGLEPIPCVGEPFDAERMEVLEAVADSGRPSGEVVGVVRPGYMWAGRLFRCAQVRVAKGL